jgi:8-oxo-dGTP diphosphatase
VARGCPDPAAWRALQARAEADGRRCVVGALVLNQSGQVFVHRRGWDRRLLPGGWDVVGGHVEPGEGLLDALRREIEEETGWRLVGTPRLAHVGDWESDEDAGPARRREFDFLVEVEGDLERPRLERPKHVEFRWIGRHELALLAENLGRDGGLVRHLAELALRSSRPAELLEPHATVFLHAAAAAVEELRATWDPAMAWQIAAHVTVTYPVELDRLDLLVERTAGAAERVAPFRLRLGGLGHFGRPRDGIFVEDLSVTAFDGRCWQVAATVPLGA